MPALITVLFPGAHFVASTRLGASRPFSLDRSFGLGGGYHLLTDRRREAKRLAQGLSLGRLFPIGKHFTCVFLKHLYFRDEKPSALLFFFFFLQFLFSCLSPQVRFYGGIFKDWRRLVEYAACN